MRKVEGIINVEIREIIYNVIVFVPFGIFLNMVRKNNIIWKNIFIIFCTSLTFEVLQYVLAIGASDVTDVIGNTTGGIIGIGAYTFFAKFGKANIDKVINWIYRKRRL